ncbi:hypothetical protein [Nonomuraea sp. NPDC049725]|uniref:hypothetical protein n=1 Tax=Nonomuraea sp. NPDC049725 TaxID=3154508 RepID=UPI003419A1EA
MPLLGFALSCCILPFGLGLSALLVLALEWLAPDVIPFELDTFWALDRPLWPAFTGAVTLVWPVLAAGLLITAIAAPRQRHAQRQLAAYGVEDAQVIRLGPARMLFQSALEEIAFRWVLFYAAIAGATFADFVLLGFADLHPVRWLFTEVLIPLADLATFGMLHEQLTLGAWAVAAAILASNGRFRNGHLYQGLIGWIWSWYMGMFLFLVMFEYGLPAAIAVHVAYNLVTLALHVAITGVAPRVVVLNLEPQPLQE